MPIYEYKCNSCENIFEYLLRKADEKVFCPCCGKKDIRRLVSSFSFAAKDSSGRVTSLSSSCSSCRSNNCSSCSR